MKLFSALIAVVFLIGCATTPRPKEKIVFEDEIDRFTNTRKISWMHAHVHDLIPTASFFAEKKLSSPATSPTLLVLMSVSSPSWVYLKCNKNFWLADGLPITPVRQAHTGNVAIGKVSEVIQAYITMPEANIMATSKSIEYKICNDVFKLTDAEREGLIRVVNAFNS